MAFSKQEFASEEDSSATEMHIAPAGQDFFSRKWESLLGRSCLRIAFHTAKVSSVASYDIVFFYKANLNPTM